MTTINITLKAIYCPNCGGLKGEITPGSCARYVCRSCDIQFLASVTHTGVVQVIDKQSREQPRKQVVCIAGVEVFG